MGKILINKSSAVQKVLKMRLVKGEEMCNHFGEREEKLEILATIGVTCDEQRKGAVLISLLFGHDRYEATIASISTMSKDLTT